MLFFDIIVRPGVGEVGFEGGRFRPPPASREGGVGGLQKVERVLI